MRRLLPFVGVLVLVLALAALAGWLLYGAPL